MTVLKTAPKPESTHVMFLQFIKGRMLITADYRMLISDYSCEHLTQLCLYVDHYLLLCYYFSCILCFTLMKVMTQNNREKNCRSNSVLKVEGRLWSTASENSPKTKDCLSDTTECDERAHQINVWSSRLGSPGLWLSVNWCLKKLWKYEHQQQEARAASFHQRHR